MSYDLQCYVMDELGYRNVLESINITSNYRGFFHVLFGPAGIRFCAYSNSREIEPIIDAAFQILPDDGIVDWVPTPNGVKDFLARWLRIIRKYPEGYWSVST